MAKSIVVLSGPIAAGKSSLAANLVERFNFTRIETRTLLRAASGVENERLSLQRAGEELDKKTGGRWLSDALAQEVAKLPADARVVLDSVRIEPQIELIRTAFGARVTHVHLSAQQEALAKRHEARNAKGKEVRDYAQVRKSETERGVADLAQTSDVLIETTLISPEDVFVRVACHLGLYGRTIERLVDVLIGGQYGSEGKGNIVSFIAGEYDVLIRTGGPNAGHKVFEVPKPYSFHHLPSGTRCTEAQLILGPGAVIGLPKLQEEIADCQVSKDRLSIDPQAMIIDADDIAKEKERLAGAIGSTAQGVGLATARKILRIATPPVQLARDIKELAPYVRETRPLLERAYSQGKKVLVEGTQGTGLSLHHGTYPYVTSRETSASAVLAEAGIAPSRVRKIMMVCRTYPIRVQDPPGGSSGPMTAELKWEDISERSGIPLAKLLDTELTTTTKRKRRVAEFDWALLHKAAFLNGPTDIALTFADYISIENQKAKRFEQLTAETIRFIEEVERVAGAPVSLVSTGFNNRCVIDRRAW